MNQQKNVHYFPGHMKKALVSLEKFISAIDLVIEVVDSRIPLSSRNPLLDKLIGNKARVVFLSKEDLADLSVLKEWKEYFKSNNVMVASSDLKHEKAMKLIEEAAKPYIEVKRAKEEKKGMKPQPCRLLIVGVPNVGKSTLINNLAGKQVAKAGNKPGVTRAEQWIKLPSSFVLLDSPGILPMRYEDKNAAINLALVGSIKEEVLPIAELSDYLLNILKNRYLPSLNERYEVSVKAETPNEEIFSLIASKRGYLLKGGVPDIEKASSLLIKEFQAGYLGRISLEEPNAK